MDLPSKLPGSLHVDRQSEWQTSAVISSALETVTLPSRLRPYHAFEASLAGDDGTHNIFELQSTIVHDGGHRPLNEDGSSEVETQFDIDFTYGDEDRTTPHIFNQVQVMRGNEPHQTGSSIDASGDIGHRRKLRLYDSKPMLHRWAIRCSV